MTNNNGGGGIGFSVSDFLDVGDQYQSLAFGHLQFRAGYTPVDVRMKFNEHTSPMMFQICPYTADGRDMPPVIEQHGELKPTPWFFRVPIVSCGSAEKISFVMFDPAKERRKEYSIRDNPYYKLRSRVARAVSSGHNEAWAVHIKGAMDIPIPNYKDQYFVQGVVWTDGESPVYNDKVQPVGLRPEDKTLALIRLSKTAIEPIRAAVIAAHMNDIESISLNQPQYFGIANRKKCPDIQSWIDYSRQSQRAAAAASFQQTSVSSMADLAAFNTAAAAVGMTTEGEDELVGYEAGMSAHTCLYDKGQFKMPLPPINFHQLGWDHECRRKFVSWENVFQVMSDQEQAVHIARALSDLPELLMYAWGDTEYWTDEVQGIVKKRMAMRAGANRLDDNVTAGFGQTGVGGAFQPPAAGGVVPSSAMGVFGQNPHAAAQSQPLPQVQQTLVPTAISQTPTPTAIAQQPSQEDVMAALLGGGGQ